MNHQVGLHQEFQGRIRAGNIASPADQQVAQLGHRFNRITPRDFQPGAVGNRRVCQREHATVAADIDSQLIGDHVENFSDIQNRLVARHIFAFESYGIFYPRRDRPPRTSSRFYRRLLMQWTESRRCSVYKILLSRAHCPLLFRRT